MRAARKFPGLFDGVATHVLPAGRLTGKPTSWLPGVRAIMHGPGVRRARYTSNASRRR